MPVANPRTRATNAGKAAKATKAPKLSRTHAPDDLSLLEWQRGLRRQFGRDQAFGLQNLGREAFFSDFRVSNPQSKSAYRVAIRSQRPGENFCECLDYATNELGTCKHIEFVLAALENKRGFKSAMARGYRPPFSEIYLRNDGGRSIHFRPGADCPAGVDRAARAIFTADDAWRLVPERFDTLPRFLALVAKSGHELRAYDDALDFVAGCRDSEQRRRKLAELYQHRAAESRLGKLLKVQLYPYQAEGALFAVAAGRALIGDEMGLGKTIQAIAAAEILARHFGVTRVLVVCPTSLKYQWQSEILRFSGRDSRVIGGGRVQREKEHAAEDFCKITNYEKLSRDLDLIAAWAPELVIVDEAQRVKNWNTVAARALKRIDSPYAVVLTGTPLENKLEELISIVQFVDQHRLGPTWKLLHKHQVKDDGGRVTGYRDLEQIGETLAPVMIRRRKSEVLLQLPERTDQNLLVPMTGEQMGYHEENAEIVGQIVQRWRRMKFLSDKDQRRLTCCLQNMRMACNSTYLLDLKTDHGVKADELLNLLLEALADPEAKAVVFSQWVRTHEILIRRLEANNIGYVSFHGGIASEQRPALIERFRDDPACRVFLSTDAGATGLNLQRANLLVNMDLPWNPALLEQRIARIHRMGQKQPVQIVNFVAKGSIEEGMLATLAFKRSLAAGILDGGVGEISLGGSRLNRFMKDVENVTGHMGGGDTLTPDEECLSEDVEAAADEADERQPAAAAPLSGSEAEPAPSAGEPVTDVTPTQASSSPADPWVALVDVGAQLVAALASGHDAKAPTHPWVEQDSRTGARHLKIPMPPPETASRLADALSALAQALRR
ncbi:MAG: DEAD/DEAH box helicase family protein [Dechloromonas sp.]|nr:MAG: DEAD/DEAH box helicase family protein [Dechloromonas sp.]